MTPARLASFHLLREPSWRAPVAMARLGTDRLRLRRVPGLRFARLLGTGRGSETAPSIEPSRTALFAVWDSPDALTAFESGPLAARSRRTVARGGEAYTVRLALLSGHGRWGGQDVLDGLAGPVPGPADGPVAVLTRATVRWRALRDFRAAARTVSDELAAAPGLLSAVAIGEAPVGLQATFSLWRDLDAMRAFARHGRHRDTVRRTRDDGWYGEELFARFAPLASTGTWDGRDPLVRPAPGCHPG